MGDYCFRGGWLEEPPRRGDTCLRGKKLGMSLKRDNPRLFFTQEKFLETDQFLFLTRVIFWICGKRRRRRKG